jgi:hypothetical protein
VRHIETNNLWLQDKVGSKAIQIVKANGKENLADALTKHVSHEEIGTHVRGTSLTFGAGRHMLMHASHLNYNVGDQSIFLGMRHRIW